MRHCKKCGKTKPDRAFCPSRPACKACDNAVRRLRYKTSAAAREKVKAGNQRFYEKNAERLIEDWKRYRSENLDRVKEYLKRYRERNRERANAYAKEYRENNPERVRQWHLENKAYTAERNREWRKANPEKVAEKTRRRRVQKQRAPGTHTVAEWRALVFRFDGCCVCCKKHFDLKGLTEDHVVPLTWGGSDGIENIQPLCVSCNTSKGNRHATDYR